MSDSWAMIYDVRTYKHTITNALHVIPTMATKQSKQHKNSTCSNRFRSELRHMFHIYVCMLVACLLNSLTTNFCELTTDRTQPNNHAHRSDYLQINSYLTSRNARRKEPLRKSDDNVIGFEHKKCPKSLIDEK